MKGGYFKELKRKGVHSKTTAEGYSALLDEYLDDVQNELEHFDMGSDNAGSPFLNFVKNDGIQRAPLLGAVLKFLCLYSNEYKDNQHFIALRKRVEEKYDENRETARLQRNARKYKASDECDTLAKKEMLDDDALKLLAQLFLQSHVGITKYKTLLQSENVQSVFKDETKRTVFVEELKNVILQKKSIGHSLSHKSQSKLKDIIQSIEVFSPDIAKSLSESLYGPTKIRTKARQSTMKRPQSDLNNSAKKQRMDLEDPSDHSQDASAGFNSTRMLNHLAASNDVLNSPMLEMSTTGIDQESQHWFLFPIKFAPEEVNLQPLNRLNDMDGMQRN